MINYNVNFMQNLGERWQNAAKNDSNDSERRDLCKVTKEVTKFLKNNEDNSLELSNALLKGFSTGNPESESLVKWIVKPGTGFGTYEIIHDLFSSIVTGDERELQNLMSIDSTSLQELTEPLKKEALKCGWKLSRNISYQGITDQRTLIEIAKIAVRGYGTSQYIHNYNIKDEQALIEIAKIAAVHDAAGTSEHIKKYGIKDEQALIEIAKIASVRDVEGTSNHIKEYDITDQKALIEIAESMALQNGAALSSNIQEFGITDQNALIRIAKIIAAQSGEEISKNIEKFGIKDPKALIEIAKIAVDQNSWGTSRAIKNYGIEDQTALIDIARIAIHKDAVGTSEFIHNYGIRDQEVLIDCAKQASAQDIKTLEYIHNYRIMNFNKIAEIIAPFQKDAATHEYVNNIKNPQVELARIKNAALDDKASKQLNYLFENDYLKAVFSYPNPRVREQLTKDIADLVKNKDLDSLLIKLEARPHAKLSMFLLALLRDQGVEKSTCDKLFKLANLTTFKDGRNLRVLVNALYAVIQNNALTLEDKEFLFSKITSNPKLIIPTLHVVNTLNSLENLSELKKDNLENSTFENILQNAVKTLIPIKDIPDFNEKFTKKFATERFPNFILTYASKLNSFYGEDNLLKFLASCVEGIMEDAYPSMRYNMEGLHLQTVFTGRKELLEEWKKGEKLSLGDFLIDKDPEVMPVTFLSLLTEKIVGEHHLQRDNVPLLFDFLEHGKSAQIDEKINDPLLKLQKNCIALTDNKLTFEKQKELIKEITDNLNKIGNLTEFKDDIKEFLSTLIKQHDTKGNLNKFTIVDTDNYLDLFLAGSEVGSCQGVDGEPHDNVCLMGYVADGKNRLIAIKDKDGRIIARQIFRILWDGEKPVLFTEKVYPANTKYKKALELFAKQRASKLNLPLVTKEDNGRSLYDKPVHSLGSPAPYEYSDGSGGVTRGCYAIYDAHFV